MSVRTIREGSTSSETMLIIFDDEAGETHGRYDGPRVTVGVYQLPPRIDVVASSRGRPTITATIEVSSAGAKLTELSFHTAQADQQGPGIGQADIRRLNITEFVTYALVAAIGEATPGQTFYGEQVDAVRRGRREITEETLKETARVYRDNLATAPTAAVELHFQIGRRMAGQYIARARKAGYLPTTKQGQKKA